MGRRFPERRPKRENNGFMDGDLKKGKAGRPSELILQHPISERTAFPDRSVRLGSPSFLSASTKWRGRRWCAQRRRTAVEHAALMIQISCLVSQFFLN